AFPSAYVRECLEPFGFGDKWVYRTDAESVGMSPARFKEVCAQADLLLVRAIPLWEWRDEYGLPDRRIFIDVDPGFTQMNIAAGDQGYAEAIRPCEKLFSIGQRLGQPDCPIPVEGWAWQKTLPPVVLGEWPWLSGPQSAHFTSIMRWDGFQDARYQ